ncbi:hypothetical protein FE782_23815 [Paenibacillus antri]|uniref:Uncharacterized protein n=1 Tax=Paenibacillus antri TaxID=2582848 RepID=A0A5R9G1M3_9BACL|nr:hypothetical protein [Paenibacillus antri]TLS49701.1 hypothetical protein FE782_23815 [Paenibacillus antri]
MIATDIPPVDYAELFASIDTLVRTTFLVYAILAANVAVTSLMLLIDLKFRIIDGALDGGLILEHSIRMVTNAVAAVGIAQTPLAIAAFGFLLTTLTLRSIDRADVV